MRRRALTARKRYDIAKNRSRKKRTFEIEAREAMPVPATMPAAIPTQRPGMETSCVEGPHDRRECME